MPETNGSLSNGDNWRERMERVERNLERITERHQALAETVEIVGAMQRKNEEAQSKNEALLAQVIESINSLARIAQAHERRIEDLEG